MKKLTQAQKRILNFVERHIDGNGMPPTVREIGARFGIASPNGVAVHLAALERKGYVRRKPGIARGLEIVRPGGRGLPVAGTIAAGKPVEAIEDDEESLDVGGIFKQRGAYVLRVKGDSMVDDCIQEGDYVVVERRSSPRDGEIVVALIDGADATLKRFFREKKRIRLEPANARMKPIYVDDVKIQGVVRGVVRRY